MTSTKAKRKEWEGLKACGENKTNAEVFYRGFQSKIIQPERIGHHEGRKKNTGQEADQACPEQVYRMRNMDMASG